MATITIAGDTFDSYVEVSEATEYFVGRIHDADWLAAEASDPVDIDKALISATALLDELPWIGYASTEDQALAWPRVGSFYNVSRGRNVTLDSTATEAPDQVKKATFELAYHILVNEDALESSTSVDGLNVGSISLQTLKQAPVIPARVRKIVKDLLIAGGSRAWFRSN